MNRVLQLAKMRQGAENIFIRGAARLAVSDIHVSSSFAAPSFLERRWRNHDDASVRRIHGSPRTSLFPAKDQIGGQLRRCLIVETCAEPVKVQRLSGSDSGIIEVTLDRPGAMNAIGTDTLKYLQRIIETLNEDSSARVVILCSSLPKVFCAGADLKERRRMNVSEVENFVSSLRSTFSFLEALSVPTIAVIEGAALGGGLELALSCDLRVCGDAATFGMPETGLAIIPGAGGTQRLPRLIGRSQAKELILTGCKVDGKQALSLGLVNHCVAAGDAYSCSSTRISHGLSADRISVDDYQDLLDRGWRRSGKFLYKPEMERTCCPPYTIRLKVDAFVPTKEQKRVQRRIQRYMDGTNDGLRTVEYRQKENNIKCRKSSSSITSIFETAEMPQVSASSKVSANTVNSKTPEVDSTAKSISSKIDVALKACVESGELPADAKFPLTTVKRLTAGMKKKLKGVSRDIEYTSSISFQIAASLRRKLVPENIKSAFDVSLDVKGHKEISEQLSPMVIAEKLASKVETSGLSGFLVQACNGHLNFMSVSVSEDSMQSIRCENFPVMECDLPSPRKTGGNCKRDKDFDDNKNFQHHEKHKLEIRMKRSTFDPEEFALYKKYQIRVHNDRPEEVRESSYKRFLVETPLIFVPPENDNSAPPCGFGSFHQQYLIDGRLVAVGVVDILPRCLSSKYMFWDPDLAFLSLGKYSALEEIKWVQAAQKHCPTLQYYYLGYYIHSCPKMRYKAAYNPSELLCAVHYQWTPFQLAKLVLDKAAYLCLCDVCDHAEPILSPATDEMHDSYGQDDHEMEDNLEFCDGELHEFQSSGSSDHSMGVENGVEAPAVDFDTEDIGGVLIQWNGLRFRFKDLKASGIMGRRSIDLLTGHLQKYIKVVGTELSERIAYCLD